MFKSLAFWQNYSLSARTDILYKSWLEQTSKGLEVKEEPESLAWKMESPRKEVSRKY